jgi:hypothetical protein
MGIGFCRTRLRRRPKPPISSRPTIPCPILVGGAGGLEPAMVGRLDCLTRPRSEDRSRSPSSLPKKKRQFFKYPPETICDFGLRMPKNQSLETGDQFAKVRRWQTFLRLSGPACPIAGLPGWGSRIRTSRWRIGNRTPSPVREKPQNLFPRSS